MYQTRKIGVVGQGHVGAHVANSLLMQGIADELYLCDINETKVTSEVQDLRDSLSFVPYNTKIVNCYDHYEELACCDVIVNAAGKVALAAGNRDGELFFTTDAARTFAKRIVDAGFDGIFVSISNPCDVVCTELWHLTGYDPKKIIGSGCGLDSARLRTEISKKVGVSPKSIDAYMIGEHGFSQLAAFKAATVAGKSLNELQAENPDKYAFDHMEIEELARKGGYVTYQGKQCTEYAVANSAARVCAAVLHNEHAVLSASTLMPASMARRASSPPCRAWSVPRASRRSTRSTFPSMSSRASTRAASTSAITSPSSTGGTPRPTTQSRPPLDATPRSYGRHVKRAAPETHRRGPLFIDPNSMPADLGLILFREVNEQKRAPEASTLFRRRFLRFRRVFPAVLASKSVDASGVQNRSFTSRKSIRLRFRADTNPATTMQNGVRAQHRPRQKR